MEGLIDEQSAKHRKIVFYALSIVIYVIFFGCVFSSLVTSGLYDVYDFFMQMTLVASYGIFTVIYLVTLIQLITAMNRLIASDLENERRSVII